MYIFRETAVSWLNEQGFSDNDIEELQKIMNMIGKKNEGIVKIPGTTSPKVSAMVYLLDSITDDSGNLACIDGNLIEIPDEAKKYYGDDVKIAELEDALEKIQNIKTGRSHASPRRRGSGIKEY